jgi:diguanylate cyclase (GGDEF)-like protein
MRSPWIDRILKWIEAQPKAVLLPAAFMALGLIGWIEYATREAISVSILYLVPITLIAWTQNRWLAWLFCFFGASGWLITDILQRGHFDPPWAPFWNAGVRLGTFGIVAMLLAQLRDAMEQEKRRARTDALTGLPNFRSFSEWAEIEIQRARRNGQPLTVAYIDVDNFKEFNDQHGHLKGDLLLHKVGQALQDNLRATDVRGRLGGDEFAVILPGLGPRDALSVLEELNARLVSSMPDMDTRITFSIGGVTFTTPSPSAQAMLREADALMYEVKASQKNALLHRIYSGETRTQSLGA